MPDNQQRYTELVDELGGAGIVALLTSTYLPHVRQRIEGSWDPSDEDVAELEEAVQRRDGWDQGTTLHTYAFDFFNEDYRDDVTLSYLHEGLRVSTKRPQKVDELLTALITGAHRIEKLFEEAHYVEDYGTSFQEDLEAGAEFEIAAWEEQDRHLSLVRDLPGDA